VVFDSTLCGTDGKKKKEMWWIRRSKEKSYVCEREVEFSSLKGWVKFSWT
jgi:hypothetical protein